MRRYRRLEAGLALLAMSICAWAFWSGRAPRHLRPLMPPRGAQSPPAGASALSSGSAPELAAAARESLVSIGPAPQPEASVPPVWTPAAGAAPQLAGLQNGLVRDVQHVRLDHGVIARIEVGSLVPIDLPGGEHFLARVQRLAANESGDRWWSGHIEGFGMRYPVVYTQGEASAFATITTPAGLYALEAAGEDAVLYRDEREGLQDPGAECSVIPG